MSALAIKCGKCQAPVPDEYFNRPDFSPCGTCGSSLKVEVFPARFRAPPRVSVSAAAGEEEASCFFHPDKKALLPCDSCGRFLCGLCDCEIRGQHLCPNCLESGRRKEKIRDLESRRILYDRIALAVALYPIIFSYITIITAPVAIFVAFRYWNAPSSIVRRSKVRFVIAILVALLELALWGIVIFALTRHK